MSSELIDIHDEKPLVPLYIDRVGLKNYRVQARVCSVECRDYIVELSVLIDLPFDKRGVHVSRLVDSVRKVFRNTHSSLIEYIRRVADYCLENNQYSSIAEVIGSTKTIHSDSEVGIEIGVLRKRDGYGREYLKVSFRGVTSCPCAQRIYSYYEKTILEKTPTHMQRVLLKTTVIGDRLNIDPLEIHSIGINVFSGKLVNYLNRYSEYSLLREIISKPLFAEDVIRNFAREFYFYFMNRLSNSTEVVFEIVSEETLHDFDLYAVLKTSINELGEYFRNT